MKLSELLKLIYDLARSKKYSMPFIVGGLPRDKILNKYNDISDIDITTGHNDIKLLASDVYNELKNIVSTFKTFEDGHIKMIIGDTQIDFSSNFKVPGISYLLQGKKIKEPTEMQKELYSRDFTCNSLLMSLDLTTVYDIIGTSVKDINNKIIKTNLSPEITFGYSPNRIIRVIYLAAKLNFDVDINIIWWIKEHKEQIKDINPTYLSNRLQKAIDYDVNKTIYLLDKTGLWDYVPPLEQLVPYINQRLLRR